MANLLSKDKLMDMRNSGERFRLVDVLPRESFEKEHIPGSISIPLAEIGAKAEGLLKKDETIVTYCASFDCKASTEAAEKLMAMGYKNVLDYKGGLKEYKEANLPLEGSAHEAACTSGCCSCG